MVDGIHSYHGKPQSTQAHSKTSGTLDTDFRKFENFRNDMSVLKSAHGGCYLANPNDAGVYPKWIYGCESHNFGPMDAPDIAIDPDDGILTLINTSCLPRTYFVTVENSSAVLTFDGCNILQECVDTHGMDYVTFVSVVKAGEMVSLARLVPKTNGKRIRRRDFASIQISSDIQDFIQTKTEHDIFDLTSFPLSNAADGDFLCSQSSGGALTHFAHPSTFYAVDFRCNIGTSVVAVFDAEVVEIRNETDKSGVHVSNLFHWNSIMIKKIGSNIFAEYVHIKKDSFTVNVGDIVKEGQVICLSGNAGFCPEPHLHFELHSSSEPGNPSVPITYRGEPFQVDKIYS